MKLFREAGGQVDRKTQKAAAQPDNLPKVQAVVTKKAVRKLSCWSGSGAAGEAEDVTSPLGSPASDRIKATSGAVVLDSHQPQQPAAVTGTSTHFSSKPLLGAQRDVTVEEHITKFAGRMGNIVASSMAGGFGATLGSRAAHSVWNGLTGR
ncbi:MAG: hypothetical protein FRX49_12254 [Trebouxia sp. A1-2]|nr:MAG: hypothetical protein FRX49_12254 [Trebouxia sp. A1-2]